MKNMLVFFLCIFSYFEFINFILKNNNSTILAAQFLPIGHCPNAYMASRPLLPEGAGRSSVVRAFAHDAMGHRIDSSWGGPIELFLVPASAPRLV